MSKVKDKATEAKTVVQNVGEFLDGVSFAAVAGFAVFWSIDNLENVRWFVPTWNKALLLAGLVVTVQAFVLLVRHFKKTQ